MVTKAEARANAAGLSINKLCKLAGINRSAWHRWKAGDRSPMLLVWERCIEVIESHEIMSRADALRGTPTKPFEKYQKKVATPPPSERGP